MTTASGVVQTYYALQAAGEVLRLMGRGTLADWAACGNRGAKSEARTMGGKSGLPWFAWPGGTQGSGRKQGNPKTCEQCGALVAPRFDL